MAEEIQFMHEELTNLGTEIQGGIDELRKNSKKFDTNVRNEKVEGCSQKYETSMIFWIVQVAYLQNRLSRCKDVLQNFRVELREVLKESGRATYSDFEAKGKVHNANVAKLATELEAFRVAEEKRDLVKEAKAKKGKVEEQGGNVIIEKAKEVQLETAAALNRGAQLVQQMEEVGAQTNIELKAQTEQMKNTNADVQRVDAELAAAQKAVRDIARKMASDKVIMCLVLVLIALIVAIIVLKAVDPSIFGQKNDPCSLLSLNVLETVPQCRTKYLIMIILKFDSSLVNENNYDTMYSTATQIGLSQFTGQYTSGNSVVTSKLGTTTSRRAVSLFQVQAKMEVRGENNAMALVEMFKNSTALASLTKILSNLNVPGLKELSRPYYCTESTDVAMMCAVPPTQSSSSSSSSSSGSDSPSPPPPSSGGLSPAPSPSPSTTPSSKENESAINVTVLYTSTWADFAPLSSETVLTSETVNVTTPVGITESGNLTESQALNHANETSVNTSRRLLGFKPRNRRNGDDITRTGEDGERVEKIRGSKRRRDKL